MYSKKSVEQAFIFILCVFASLRASAQPQVLQKQNDSTWRIVTIVQGVQGSYSLQYSPIMDSTKALERYMQIMSDKKFIIDSSLLQREYDEYNTHIKKITGQSYESIQSSRVMSALDGEWIIENGTDTLEVKVKNLKVSGGTIKGSLSVIDNRSVKITGVVGNGSTTLTLNKPGVLEGVSGGKKVVMRRA